MVWDGWHKMFWCLQLPLEMRCLLSFCDLDEPVEKLQSLGMGLNIGGSTHWLQSHGSPSQFILKHGYLRLFRKRFKVHVPRFKVHVVERVGLKAAEECVRTMQCYVQVATSRTERGVRPCCSARRPCQRCHDNARWSDAFRLLYMLNG
jgi:hypothetical protein